MAQRKRTMTPEHKAAIAAGRSEGAAVKRYLESLGKRGKPGRRVSRAELKKRLEETDKAIPGETNPLKQLDLEQRRLDLRQRLEATSTKDNSRDAEAAFVKVAKDYAERKSISYAAFRSMGVPASVLSKAGIARSRTS